MNDDDINTLHHLGTLLHRAADEIRYLQTELEQARRWENIADGLANTSPQHDWQDSRIAYEIAKNSYRNHNDR